MYAHDVDDFNEILSPTDVLAYDELPTVSTTMQSLLPFPPSSFSSHPSILVHFRPGSMCMGLCLLV